MTKADIVAKISDKLGLEKGDVQAVVENFMEEVKVSLEKEDKFIYEVSEVLSSKKELKKQEETLPKIQQ